MHIDQQTIRRRKKADVPRRREESEIRREKGNEGIGDPPKGCQAVKIRIGEEQYKAKEEGIWGGSQRIN